MLGPHASCYLCTLLKDAGVILQTHTGTQRTLGQRLREGRHINLAALVLRHAPAGRLWRRPLRRLPVPVQAVHAFLLAGRRRRGAEQVIIIVGLRQTNRLTGGC